MSATAQGPVSVPAPRSSARSAHARGHLLVSAPAGFGRQHVPALRVFRSASQAAQRRAVSSLAPAIDPDRSIARARSPMSIRCGYRTRSFWPR